MVRDVEEGEEEGALSVARRAPEGVNRLRELGLRDKCGELGGEVQRGGDGGGDGLAKELGEGFRFEDAHCRGGELLEARGW